jgi:hypothetical protein
MELESDAGKQARSSNSPQRIRRWHYPEPVPPFPVQELNGFLRGWVCYLRYGSSARHLDKIRTYTLSRIAYFVAERHKSERGYGWGRVAYDSPDSLGLIALNGSVVAHGRTGPGGKSRMRRGEGCR